MHAFFIKNFIFHITHIFEWQVVIGEESYHQIYELSFTIYLARAALVFKSDAILALYAGNFICLLSTSSHYPLLIVSLFSMCLGLFHQKQAISGCSLLPHPVPEVDKWLQEIQNLHKVWKLTCYLGIILIWDQNFSLEMARLVFCFTIAYFRQP